MTKELLDQLKCFEIFVERMEAFVQEVTEENKEEYMMCDFDLRTAQPFDTQFRLPSKLEDYFNMWKLVQKAYEHYKKNGENANEFFFDLYWNDIVSKPPTAYYHDKVFWVYFDDEKGICYDIPV